MDRNGETSWAIVVVNYGSHLLLKANLLPLARQSPEAHIVVVDSFSSVDERNAVQELAHANGWHLVLPETNVGFGRGMNLGVARALKLGAERVLLINPDATMERRDVELLHAEVAASPMTMCAPIIRTSRGAVWFSGADLYLHDGSIRSERWRKTVNAPYHSWLSGACLMISKQLWNAVAGFDEDYFLYWEDVDLSHRILKAGGCLKCVRSATAVHDEGGTHTDDTSGTRHRAKSPTYYYYNIRNRMMFARKNLSPEDQRRWQRGSLKAAREILLRGGRRQFLHRPRQAISPAFRGLRDGLLPRGASPRSSGTKSGG
ncbi:glycosyltransferase family 2 protein [Pseudarthrobacter sp. PvP090]|uniref:glycosyltransferase family 2 protein n=1 Tax=Pseudarthrobacter sp. PvP090 TaxID=3156393 RepID=UPI00339472D1